MSSRKILWLVSLASYIAFFSWYTDFGGPMSDEEVDSYLAQMTDEDSNPEVLAVIETFARSDSGRQFVMLNAVDYNENPPHVEGAEPGESAEQLMGRYMAHMFPAMLSRASHPVFMGYAVSNSVDLVGIENAEVWDMGVLMRYRSRRTLMDILSNPEFGGNHEFKLASLTKTIAYPIEPEFYLGDLRVLLGLLLLAITALIDNLLLSRRNRAN